MSEASPERLAAILNDEAAIKILAVWELVPRVERAPKELARILAHQGNIKLVLDGTQNEWLRWKIEIADIARLANVDPGVAHETFDRLRCLQLLFADGTIDPLARGLLGAKIRDAVKARGAKGK
jgi:hypothetical protein